MAQTTIEYQNVAIDKLLYSSESFAEYKNVHEADLPPFYHAKDQTIQRIFVLV